MKKSIALLGSIVLIGVISVLIAQNLHMSDKFLKKQGEDYYNTHALISIDNYKNEIAKLLIKHKKNLNELLSNDIFKKEIPIPLGEFDTTVYLKSIDSSYNINLLFEENNIKKEKLKQLFLENGIEFYDFNSFLLKQMDQVDTQNRGLENKKQLELVIDKYIKQSYDNSINKIKDQFIVSQTNEILNLIFCKLTFDIGGKNYTSSFFYNLNQVFQDNIEVSDFEISFK